MPKQSWSMKKTPLALAWVGTVLVSLATTVALFFGWGGTQLSSTVLLVLSCGSEWGGAESGVEFVLSTRE